jgi:hypothetical protein
MSRVRREDWASQLNEFSKRNVGRCTVLEIREPKIGIHEEQAGYRLQGVSFDERGNRITVLVGGETAAAPHVTHVSHGPRRVEIVHQPDGRDGALHVKDRFGSMLLALV